MGLLLLKLAQCHNFEFMTLARLDRCFQLFSKFLEKHKTQVQCGYVCVLILIVFLAFIFLFTILFLCFLTWLASEVID